MKADNGSGSSAIARPITTRLSATAVPFLTRRKVWAFSGRPP